jgi:hypothetical protein
MTRLIIDVDKESDLNVLIPLLKRLKIRFQEEKNIQLTDSERQKLIDIIMKGGDFSYLGDPLEWQKEQRKDRDLPYHILE